MRKLYEKYRSIIVYIFYGVLAAIVNILVYHILFNRLEVSNSVSTIIAWIAAFLFAFFSNKLRVFKSTEKKASVWLFEFGTFFLCRALTGVLDLGIMYFGVDVYGKFLAENISLYKFFAAWFHKSAFEINSLTMKLLSNVIVTILNYIASKLLIFRKK